MSPDVRKLERWAEEARGRWLDLILAGVPIDGRLGEAARRLRSAAFDGHELVVEFADDERLVVVDPSGFVTADGALTIPEAAEVRFGWYLYGHERGPARRCELAWRRDGPMIEATASGPTAERRPRERFALAGRPMVRIQ